MDETKLEAQFLEAIAVAYGDEEPLTPAQLDELRLMFYTGAGYGATLTEQSERDEVKQAVLTYGYNLENKEG